MATSIYRIDSSIVIADPAGDRTAVVNALGNISRAAFAGTKLIPANTPVELDDKLGELYIERHGGTVEEKPKTPVKAKDDDKSKSKDDDKSK